MNTFWTVLLPLAQQIPEPEDVKAGWVAFALFLLLGLAIVVLAVSMGRHLRKTRANFDARDADERQGPGPG